MLFASVKVHEKHLKDHLHCESIKLRFNFSNLTMQNYYSQNTLIKM